MWGHRLPAQNGVGEPAAPGGGHPQEAIALVHTPIGTPILAVTPEEIAVSIAGEMIQVRAQRRGPPPRLPHARLIA